MLQRVERENGRLPVGQVSHVSTCGCSRLGMKRQYLDPL
jgi:hypothetical protein